MPRILIVDDERAILSLLSKYFARAGYEVQTAGSAEEAMAFCGKESFDALLSDVHMPETSGHELVQWAAVAQPTIRCVLMSAVENDTDCGDCPYLTGCNLLSKPFNPANAVALIDKVLQEAWQSTPD